MHRCVICSCFVIFFEVSYGVGEVKVSVARLHQALLLFALGSGKNGAPHIVSKQHARYAVRIALSLFLTCVVLVVVLTLEIFSCRDCHG